MPARYPRIYPWPSRWLMTDVRMGDALFPAIRCLPRGSGIIFRHGQLDRGERLSLGRRIGAEARRRGLVLGVAYDVALARRLGAQLVHNPTTHPGLMPFSVSVHDPHEANVAASRGATLCFISPVFATRSHPDAKGLGPAEATRLAIRAGGKAIALGGMDERRFRALGPQFHGYAGIDCWIRT